MLFLIWTRRKRVNGREELLGIHQSAAPLPRIIFSVCGVHAVFYIAFPFVHLSFPFLVFNHGQNKSITSIPFFRAVLKPHYPFCQRLSEQKCQVII